MSTTSEADHSVIIVGSGFAGLGRAIRLKQQGEDPVLGAAATVKRD